MHALIVDTLLLVLGVACAGLGWSTADVVVRRREGDGRS